MSTTFINFQKKSFQWSLKFLFKGLLSMLLLISCTSLAQVNSYFFSTTTGNTLETGGFTNLLGTFLDDDASAIAPIGFTFNYGGTNYTNFSVTSNGLMHLGGSAVTDYENVISNLSGAYLIPYWDDNYTDADGNVQYKLMGAPGSRKLVVEYNLSHLGNTGTADKHFQIWLFETSNRVQFVYGAGNNLNGGFSAGISSNGMSDFMSVTVTTHTASTVATQNNNVVWPGSGRSYSFTVAPLPVSLVNFSGYKDGSRNQLQWTTTSELNNLGFEPQRSTDGINFTKIGFVNSLSIGGSSSSLLHYRFTDYGADGNKYYYRLRQVDLDSKSRLSPIIIINSLTPTEVQLNGVFPNPTQDIVNLKVTSPNSQMLAVSIYDMTGKIVLHKRLAVNKGVSIMPVSMGHLAVNNYLLKVLDGEGNFCGSINISVIK